MIYLFPGQITFLILYAIVLFLYSLSSYFSWCCNNNICSIKDVDLEKCPGSSNELSTDLHSFNVCPLESASFVSPDNKQLSTTFIASFKNNGLIRCMLLNQTELISQRRNLQDMAEFGSLIFLYFFVDRLDILLSTSKHYNRDVFYFIFSTIIIVGIISSLQTLPSSSIVLHRSQTEEWKGWMQILFIMYHYFAATELYNIIRLCVASYVWMTGYGNFIYYYKYSTFHLNRFLQTMWRLNFLVFFACLALGNRLMLYYICPMHTLFTVLVMACLMIAPRLNESSFGIWAKFFICFLFIFIVWEVPTVFEAFWWPFHWLLGFSPGDPTKSTLKEWFIRSGLDRYIWIHGMICGFLHPYVSNLVTRLEALSTLRRTIIRTIVFTLCIIIGIFYYVCVLSKPRKQYLTLHAYTSWIPISLWIILRNSTPTLRERHIRLLGWIGCITLETYISQFHIWMMTRKPDGKPLVNLQILSRKYPLLNFLLATMIFIGVSWRLFILTVRLKCIAIPNDADNRLLWRNLLLLITFCGSIYLSVAGAMSLSDVLSKNGRLTSGAEPKDMMVPAAVKAAVEIKNDQN